MLTVERNKLEDIMMAMVGLETMAYIKQVTEGDQLGFGVFAADGTQLAIFDSADQAYYTAVKHNLAPVSIH